jgi:hypothetical protein
MNRYQVVPKYPGLPVGFIKATATHRGTGKDNPLKTSGLSKLQLDRSITFIFRNVKQMAIVEEVIRMPESTDPDLDGRNFLFSFDDPARQICDAWTQPPSPPMFPPQSAVAYVIEQEYFLDESWRDGYKGWDEYVVRALERRVMERMSYQLWNTNVTSVEVELPAEVYQLPQRYMPVQSIMYGADGGPCGYNCAEGDTACTEAACLSPTVDQAQGKPLTLKISTAVLNVAEFPGTTLDVYLNRLTDVNRGLLEADFGLVANGLPTYRPLSVDGVWVRGRRAEVEVDDEDD